MFVKYLFCFYDRFNCSGVTTALPPGVIAASQAAIYRMRQLFCGNSVHLHMFINAKSGICPEDWDCRYCSQSKILTADIERYPFVSQQKLLEA
jgi:biotin synthase